MTARKAHNDLLRHKRYPRSGYYDPDWVIENQMGPNPLWLMESLTQAVTIEPRQRILDLGCGKAVSSVFLAKEFDAQVWAADLWIKPGENLKRIYEADVADQVFPVHAEAHDLPFAKGFFDLIVCVNAYQYFGTDDLYIGYIARFLRSGGRIGVVVPSMARELYDDVPEHLQPFWDWQFCSFHSPEWWRTHWVKSGKVEVEVADSLEEGWKDWLGWCETVEPSLTDEWMREAARREAEMLRADGGENLGFARVVGRKD